MAEASPGAIIGRNVRAVREAKLFSRAELANRAGVSLAGIDNLERGLSARPRRRTIEKLARALEVDVDTLLEESAYPLGQALASQDRLFDGASEREAFLRRVQDLIESVVARHERRLAKATDYETLEALLADAIDEFIHLPEYINGELTERWMLDSEVPEDVKVELGREVGAALKPLVEIVGAMGSRATMLAENTEQAAAAHPELELAPDQDNVPRLRIVA
jgi:transcriptional regulator with XRE-family HTH domain